MSVSSTVDLSTHRRLLVIAQDILKLRPDNPQLADQIRAMQGRVTSILKGTSDGRLAALDYAREVAAKNRRLKGRTTEALVMPAINRMIRANPYISAREIAQNLDDLGFKPPRGEKWSRFTVHTLIKRQKNKVENKK